MSFAARTAHDRLLRICHSYSESELVLVGEGKDQESGERRILGVGRLIGYRQMARQRSEVAVLVSVPAQGTWDRTGPPAYQSRSGEEITQPRG